MQNEIENKRKEFKENFIKRLVKFSVSILRFVPKLKQNSIFWPVLDQLVRSATSIGANVVEAKASSSKRDYLRFFEIALKSANETKYWLIVIKESAPDLADDAERLYQEADEVARIIGSSVLTLKGKR